MKTSQFWVFFVIAIVAGVALTFAVNDGVTGNASWFEQIGLTRQTVTAVQMPPTEVIEVGQVKSSTSGGIDLLNKENIFRSKLVSSGLDNKALYGDLEQYMRTFLNIYITCLDSFGDKDLCLAFTNDAWQSGTGYIQSQAGPIPQMYATAADSSKINIKIDESSSGAGGGKTVTCQCPDGSTTTCNKPPGCASNCDCTQYLGVIV